MNKLLEALRNAGIPFPKQSTESFRIVRWGKNNRYWLRKFEGGYVFGDFVTGLNSYVFDKEYKGTKLQEVREKMHDTLEKVDLESRKIHDMAATKAKFIWDSSRSIDLQDDSQGTQVDQPYLKSKKVGSHGIREYKGNLVVPAYDQDGKLWTLQFISASGEKRLDKNCEARETLSWRLIFLSSGEVDLSSHMAEENKTSKAGQISSFTEYSGKSQ